MQVLTQANPLQRLLGPGQALAAGKTGYFKAKGRILEGAALREQSKGLEHHRHAAASEGLQFASAELLQ